MSDDDETTVPEVDARLARRLVDSQFPQWADLPIRPVAHDGWDNRTFRLGAELTVRIPTGDWYARQVDKEQRWLPVLAAAAPAADPDAGGARRAGRGVPVPVVGLPVAGGRDRDAARGSTT